MTNEHLTGEPEYREHQAASLLDLSARTIRRRLALTEFPKPDGREWRRGRWCPIWKLSTLKAYRESRMKREA